MGATGMILGMKSLPFGSGEMTMTNNATSLRIMALTGTALCCLYSNSLMAQGAGAPAEQETVIDDIVVTAERRATNLQDTPLSIVAVTQETVAAKGIKDLQDLSRFAPNLSISPTRGSGANAANFTIRGISGGGGATGERGVGLYIDGIYMPRTSGAVLRVLDIDRIEVLRGPQGTLFGRNSTGGAIRIFSKQPSNKLEGSIEAVIGNFDHRDLIGMINVPITDGIAVRAQAAYLHEDGFVTRGSQKLGKQEDFIARVQARFDISDDLRATLGFLYNDSRANATPWVMSQFDMSPGIEGFIQGNYADLLNDAFKAAGQAPLAALNDSRIVRGPYQATEICLLDDFNPDFDAACNQNNNNEYWQTDLALDYDLSDTLSLHSITGLARLSHVGLSDFSLLGIETRRDDLKSKVFYQELQVNAELFNGMIDLVSGGNYFRESADTPNNIVQIRTGTSVYPSNPGTPANADAGLRNRTQTYTKQISESYGLFSSATWHATSKLNITGGLRYAWDSKDYSQTRFPANDFTPAPGTTSTTVGSSASFRALDYRATADYHFTDDIMAYATISKAYKAGQFSYTIVGWTATNNATGAAQSAGIKPIPNEKVVNYEAGLRMTLFDRRLRINPTYFIMDYTNRQAAVQVACGSGSLASFVPGSVQCPVGFLIQVQDQGNVRLHGVEVDAQLAITPNLEIDASGGFTGSKLKNPPAGTANLFPDVPSPSFNVGATYRLSTAIADATLNLNYAYVGEQATHPSEGTDSSYTLPAYDVVNARLQIKPSVLPVTITLFANNLLDSVYATYAQRFGGGFWDSGSGTGPAAPPRSALSEVRARPREVGLSLKYSF
jgi:iron complex outermembrane recepter protein